MRCCFHILYSVAYVEILHAWYVRVHLANGKKKLIGERAEQNFRSSDSESPTSPKLALELLFLSEMLINAIKPWQLRDGLQIIYVGLKCCTPLLHPLLPFLVVDCA